MELTLWVEGRGSSEENNAWLDFKHIGRETMDSRQPQCPQCLLCIQRRAVGMLLNLAEPQLFPLQNEAQIPPHTPNIVVHIHITHLKPRGVRLLW